MVPNSLVMPGYFFLEKHIFSEWQCAICIDKEYRKEIGIKLTKLAEQISDAIQLCNVAEV